MKNLVHGLVLLVQTDAADLDDLVRSHSRKVDERVAVEEDEGRSSEQLLQQNSHTLLSGDTEKTHFRAGHGRIDEVLDALDDGRPEPGDDERPDGRTDDVAEALEKGHAVAVVGRHSWEEADHCRLSFGSKPNRDEYEMCEKF